MTAFTLKNEPPHRTHWQRRRRLAHACAIMTIILLHGLFMTFIISGIAAKTFGFSKNNNPNLQAVQYGKNNHYTATFKVMPAKMQFNAQTGVPKNISSDYYRKYIKKTVGKAKNKSKDRLAQNDIEKEKKLEQLQKAANKIRANDMQDIGRFLGARKMPEPRVYYKDEINPNFNPHHAVVVHARRSKNTNGNNVYLITFRDSEQDEFVATIVDRPARDLESGGLLFNAKIIAPPESDKKPFEIRNAKLTSIIRWKNDDPKKQMWRDDNGTILTLSDKNGIKRYLHMKKTRGQRAPRGLWRSYMDFFRTNPFTNKPMTDPKDDTTVFTNLVDNTTLQLYDVKKAQSITTNVTRVRIVMIDNIGERLIYYEEGKRAEEMLRKTKNFVKGGSARGLWENVGSLLMDAAQDKIISNNRAEKKLKTDLKKKALEKSNAENQQKD